MPEPQSTLFFLLLIAVFGALVWWLVVAKQLVFRVLAACLAFVPAMMFGVAAVNKYYDYYQNWNAAISDMTNQGVRAAQVPTVSSRSGDRFGRFLGQTIDSQLAAQQGYTLLLTVHGRDSDLTRPVFVFLPPQYFWPGRYHTYRFPVIELLHGFPGNPQDWITVLGVNSLLDRLDKQHRADPAVLVMPAVNGPRGQSLQCLNQVNGPQDDTFMAGDLPRYIARVLRVQAPGVGWGVAGYSEGGFCAANLSLQHPNVFSSSTRCERSALSAVIASWRGSTRQWTCSSPCRQARCSRSSGSAPACWTGATCAVPRFSRSYSSCASRTSRSSSCLAAGTPRLPGGHCCRPCCSG